MFNFVNPPFAVNQWADDIPGTEGNNGWWVDTPTHRVIFFEGIWWDDNKAAPYKGKGDILAAFDFLPTFTKTGAYHSGFYKYAMRAIETLKSLGILEEGKKYILLGHSLGAAVAAIVAMTIPGVHGVHLYACPTAWGGPRARRKFRERYHETVNHILGNDYVQFTNIPTLWIYGSPAPIKRYKQAYKNPIHWAKGFIEDHWPWNMQSVLPYPWGV